MNAAVLPVKSLSTAKSRLAPHLSEHERLELAGTLLADALALAAAADFFTWWVVSDDYEVLRRAQRKGLEILSDEGAGLNAALRLAADHVARAGATSLTVVPSDIPLAHAGDLLDLLDTGATSDVVVVPSGDDGGTNGLYMTPPGLIAPAFGPSSFRAHVKEAEQMGVRCAILVLPRLALDLDTPADLDAFMTRARPGSGRTERLLRRLRPAQDKV